MGRTDERKQNNQRCACGSGKKYKNCCKGKPNIFQNRKPRHTSITFDMGTPIAINSYRMGVDKQGGMKLELLKDGEVIKPRAASWMVSYERQKKPKILIEIPINNDETFLHEENLMNQFDVIFAVDTNRIGEKPAVGCVAFCHKDHASRQYVCMVVDFIEMASMPENSSTEKSVWCVALQRIMSHPYYKADLRIGFIVDHDYRNIKAYNERTLPICGSFFLPDNFTMIFATSDTGGSEFIANKLIAICHRESSQYIKRTSVK